MFDELTYLIYKVLRIKGYGAVSMNKALLTLSHNEALFSNEDHSIEPLKKWIRKEFTDRFFEPDDDLNKMLNFACDKKVKFINVLNHQYPISLKKSLTNSTPPVLSYIGNVNLLNTYKVGFCGSRKASEKGLEVAKDCAIQLSERKIAVVSGYASGVDIQTHYWALKSNGATIIVLPEGINHFYIKKELKEVWDWNRVLIISEFEPNSIWSTSRAMQRNNTIIALSNAMVLIEAGEKGGSIDAGEKALRMHKYLFAPIYEGMPEHAIGNEILLNKGAYPIRKSSKTMRANLNQLLKAVAIG
ncbi:DNA-processing protein DprA [Mucilaginibacter panaciglaebae]|uniref:Smf/DprA SLOG domain-containing protein n=1 Tax=Mucilaginibacter panaciglaebae TaxID=502331 RepID=A0ABP7WYK4_9SPHI